MSGTVCSICLDELKDPVSIPCGHIHCEPCLVDYIQRAEDSITALCPSCRAPFSVAHPDLRVIPKKYHPYINTSLRRVYIPVDTNIGALNGKIVSLQRIADALRVDKARLIDRAESHIAKAQSLAVRERDARAECERRKEEQERTLKELRELETKYERMKTKYKALKHSANPPAPAPIPTAAPAVVLSQRVAKRTSDQAFKQSGSGSPSGHDDVRVIRPFPKRPRLLPDHAETRNARKHDLDERPFSRRAPSATSRAERDSDTTGQSRHLKTRQVTCARDENGQRISSRSQIVHEVFSDNEEDDEEEDDEEEFFSPPPSRSARDHATSHSLSRAGPSTSRLDAPPRPTARQIFDACIRGDAFPSSSTHDCAEAIRRKRENGSTISSQMRPKRTVGREASNAEERKTMYVWRGRRMVTDDEDEDIFSF